MTGLLNPNRRKYDIFFSQDSSCLLKAMGFFIRSPIYSPICFFWERSLAPKLRNLKKKKKWWTSTVARVYGRGAPYDYNPPHTRTHARSGSPPDKRFLVGCGAFTTGKPCFVFDELLEISTGKYFGAARGLMRLAEQLTALHALRTRCPPDG